MQDFTYIVTMTPKQIYFIYILVKKWNHEMMSYMYVGDALEAARTVTLLYLTFVVLLAITIEWVDRCNAMAYLDSHAIS